VDHRGELEVIRRVGARVRQARSDRRLTMREVAERSGLSLRFLSQLEAGEANIAIGRLAAVATALGVPLADLVAENGTNGEAKRDVALLGLRGAGKSTIGPRLAERLGAGFVELDERIEEAAGMGVAEIFSLHGEAYYRRIERECLERLLDGASAQVVALSGGIVQNEEAFALARRRCATVWLKARPEDHMKRVLAQGDRRPVANRPDAMAELRAILASREPLYQLADVTVDTSRATVDAAVDALAESLSARNRER
jgi:XRE family aerobic/anaerobic benzoate catabolism transcriptional regulator